MEQIIIEFENTTKYPLLSFMEKISDFLTNSYPEIDYYFSGKNETIESKHLSLLNEVYSEFDNLFSIFQNFSNKFSNVGFWDLLDYFYEIHSIIEKITKLPKYKRTVFYLGNYVPKVQMTGVVGGYKTFEDINTEINNTDSDGWVNLMLLNSMNETDWSIDKLKQISLFLPTQYKYVETILDQPIGERIYGIDICSKIEFEDNDLKLVYYKDNVEQKSVILLSLLRGDMPEYPEFGFEFESSNVSQFQYPKVVSDISGLFLQNDLFESVSLNDFSYKGGSAQMTLGIKTKYDYKTEKQILV